MSQTPQQTASPPAPGEPDSLARLHKMSTTAGLGSGDYVAVNGTAVAALLLGMASVLVLFEAVLLVIPLAAVVVAVIAYRQIRDSNGTQTGKGLVAAALVLALGLGGFVIAREATEGVRTREDRAAIAQLVTNVGERTRAGDYEGLYALFSDRFRERVTRADVEQRLGAIRQSELWGSLKNTSWNGLVEFDTDPASGARFAAVKIDFNVEKSDRPIPINASLRKPPGGAWAIDAMPDVFQIARPPGQPQGPEQPPQ